MKRFATLALVLVLGLWLMLGGCQKEPTGPGASTQPTRRMKIGISIPADITYPPSMIATAIHMAAAALRDGHRQAISRFVPRHMMIDVELIFPPPKTQGLLFSRFGVMKACI